MRQQNYCEALEEEITIITNNINNLRNHKWGDISRTGKYTAEERMRFGLLEASGKEEASHQRVLYSQSNCAAKKVLEWMKKDENDKSKVMRNSLCHLQVYILLRTYVHLYIRVICS